MVDDFSGSSSIGKDEFFTDGKYFFTSNIMTVFIQVIINHIRGKYLRFHAKGRSLFFIARLLVLQNHTADAIFNFLTAMPSVETFTAVYYSS